MCDRVTWEGRAHWQGGSCRPRVNSFRSAPTESAYSERASRGHSAAAPNTPQLRQFRPGILCAAREPGVTPRLQPGIAMATQLPQLCRCSPPLRRGFSWNWFPGLTWAGKTTRSRPWRRSPSTAVPTPPRPTPEPARST